MDLMRNAVDILHEEIEQLVGSLRAGIISYLGRRDELHVNSKSATLGERVLSRRLASRRLNHRLRDKKATLQLVAGWELPLYSAATAKH